MSQTGIWCTSPNGKGNGIWGAGSGLTADAEGYIYVATGNGDDTVTTPAPPPSTTIDYGDSIVKVGLTNGVPVPTDYFTPYNQAALDDGDTDVGSGGVLALPDPQPGPYPHILIQSGKQGEIYVVNRDKLTSDGSHYCNGCTSDPEIIQSLIRPSGGLWSMPAYWNSQVYMWGNGGALGGIFAYERDAFSIAYFNLGGIEQFPWLYSGRVIERNKQWDCMGGRVRRLQFARTCNSSRLFGRECFKPPIWLESHKRARHVGARGEIRRAGGHQRQGLCGR